MKEKKNNVTVKKDKVECTYNNKGKKAEKDKKRKNEKEKREKKERPIRAEVVQQLNKFARGEEKKRGADKVKQMEGKEKLSAGG